MANINHKSYIGYSELVGLKRRSSMTVIRRKVRQFKYSNTITQLAQMNSFLALSQNEPKKLQDVQGWFCANFLGEDLYEEKLQTNFGQTKSYERPVFLRQQILSMIRLCALECTESAPLIADGHTAAGFELGRSCLMMNDHLVSSRQERAITTGTPTKIRKHLLIQLAPTFELNNPPDLLRAIVRSDIIFSDILNSQKMKDVANRKLKGFDISQCFIESTGLTLEEYRDLVFMTLTWYYAQEWDEIRKQPSILQINRSTYISKSHITQNQFDKYLELDSINLMRLPDRMKEQKDLSEKLLPQYDFAIFRRWPLLELANGTLVCLDPAFLIEKLNTGFHWTIINSFSAKEDKERALQAFGHLFELYVDRIMQDMYPTNSKLLLSFPEFNGGDESFDGIVNLGDHLIVMEYKGGVLSQEAKYSGKVSLFEKALDKKFGIERGAGVYQLARKIERLFHSNPTKRESVLGLPPGRGAITKVTPVLIVQESFLRFDFVNWILNNRFQKLVKQMSITRAIDVAPLQVIDIDSLERIKVGVQAGVFRFDQCLNFRAFDDRELLSSFATYPWVHFFPDFKGVTNQEGEARLNAIMERIKIKYL